jgi:phage tail-like protein
VLNDEGKPKIIYNFQNGFPVKWDGPALNVMGDTIATETLEIAHEYLNVIG